MGFPVWAEKIFENEFELDEEPAQAAQEWLDDFVVGDSFEEFYDKQIRDTSEKRYSAGNNRAYSIREPPFNCEGKAVTGALAGELVYDRTLDLVVDWNLGQQRGNPHRNDQVSTPPVFNGHVALQDEEGTTYGGTSLMDNPQLLPVEKSAGIYLTNMAEEADFDEEMSDKSKYLAQIDPEISSQYAGARRNMIENRQ